MTKDTRTPTHAPRYELVRLSGRTDVVDFVTFMKNAARANASEVLVDAAGASGVFPNAATPIAAIIQHYRDDGMVVRVLESPDSYFAHSRIRNPLHATPENLNLPDSRLSVVWAYERGHAMALADCLIEELSRKIVFGEGVLPAINWCLFEILDNVFEHAQSDTGYFMAQIHRNSQHLTICVADTGIGIHRSFYIGGTYRPRTAFDALTLAVREGVSSTGDRRGNGLFGLKGVVERNGGQLGIASGKAYLKLSPSGMEGRNVSAGLRLDDSADCAVVDFQLNVQNPVNIGEVLGGRGYADLRLEAIEDDAGAHVIAIRDHAYGTGSREAARELRNHLQNYLRSGAGCLVLDFKDVSMVSSSFADETIGMLAAEYGAIGFSQRFRLLNMTATVQALLDRSIAIRLSDSFRRDDYTPGRR